MNSIEHFNHFLGRQPLFPYTLSANSSWISAIFTDKTFEELIYWSSPSLHKELLKIKSKKNFSPEINKVYKSLYSYWVRSYSRSTPFGINAGFYIGRVRENNISDGINAARFEVSLPKSKKRIVTPDAVFWNELIKTFFCHTCLSSIVKFYINPTVYKLGKGVRFHECLENGNYRISSVEIVEIIDLIITRIENGLRFDEIADLIGIEYEYQDRIKFIQSLVDENILINEFEYLPFDESLIDKLDQYLGKLKDKSSLFFKDILDRYQLIIEMLETSKLGDYPLHEIENLKNDLSELIGKKNLENLFHIDLLIPSEMNSVNSNDLKLIKDAIHCLTKLTSSDYTRNHEIERFKNLFFERYNNETIPLLEVLDTDSGLGFPVNNNLGVKNDSELLSLTFSPDTNSTVSNIAFDVNLYDKIQQLPIVNNEIDISKIDLSGVKSKTAYFSGTFSIIGSKLPQGSILLTSIGGSSSLNLLGRFSIKNQEVQSLCQEIFIKEKEIFKNALIAEIVFNPTGKAGNIVKRKCIADFYIPVNCGLNIPGKQAICLSDLYVTIDNGEVILISKKYNKRVIPRLSSAHNYHYSTSNIYKFLCNIQQSNNLSLSADNFYWNSGSSSCPRVKFKNLIVKPASWKFNANQYPELFKSDFNDSVLKRMFKGLQIPNEIAIKEGDNELPLKLNNEIDFKILLDYLKGNKNTELIEWLHYDSNDDDNHKYVNQFVLPLFHNNNSRIKTRNSWFCDTNLKKYFSPNSEVLSFKIYCGSFISDEILNTILYKLGNLLKKAKLIKYYFFVRYTDPHHHLRIRLFINKYTPQKYNEIVRMVIDNITLYKNQRLIWKIEIDTYERELKRYSEDNMELVEYIFYEDTKCFMNFLNSYEFLHNEITRLSLGVLSVQYWFKLVNLDFNKQLKFVKSLIDAFKDEFKNEIHVKQINNLYRECKEDINELLKLHFTKHLLTRHENINKKLIEELGKPDSIEPILKDIIHMSQNRLFPNNQRINEFVVYVIFEKIIQAQQSLVNN